MYKNLTLTLFVLCTLLTGCSSTPPAEPKYDELELLVFELCMEDALASGRIPKQFGNDYPEESKEDTQYAYEICKDFFPEKK